MNYKKKLFLNEKKISKSTNVAPVTLRITINRKSTYKTIYSIEPKYWDKKDNIVKKTYPNAAELNAWITQEVANIEREIIKLNSSQELHDVSAVRNKLQNRSSLDLFEYADKQIIQLYNSGSFATHKDYKSVIKKLQNYTKTQKLPINKITHEFIRSYEKYLSDDLKNRPNTIGKNMKVISKLINDIYKANNLEYRNNPFSNYKICRKQGERAFLSEEELGRIKMLRFRSHSPLYEARQIFTFQCYTGLRISDVLCLKWKNYKDGQLKGTIRKTNQEYNLPVSNKIKEILDTRKALLTKSGMDIESNNYIFNILTVSLDRDHEEDIFNNIGSKTTLINRRLKEIAKLAGIDKRVTTHVGRHTCATMLVSRGAEIYDVMSILGHKDVRITQIYAKITDQRKKEAMSLLDE